jgi:hypothetical protein
VPEAGKPPFPAEGEPLPPESGPPDAQGPLPDPPPQVPVGHELGATPPGGVLIVPGRPPPTAPIAAMAPASAASAGVLDMPGELGAWLPGSPQPQALGMVGDWLHTVPPEIPGGVGLGNDGGGGQLFGPNDDDAEEREDDRDEDAELADEDDGPDDEDDRDEEGDPDTDDEEDEDDDSENEEDGETDDEGEEDGDRDEEDEDRDEEDEEDEELDWPPMGKSPISKVVGSQRMKSKDHAGPSRGPSGPRSGTCERGSVMSRCDESTAALFLQIRLAGDFPYAVSRAFFVRLSGERSSAGFQEES